MALQSDVKIVVQVWFQSTSISYTSSQHVILNYKTSHIFRGFEQLSSSIYWRVTLVQSDATKVAQIASTNILYNGAEGFNLGITWLNILLLINCIYVAMIELSL